MLLTQSKNLHLLGSPGLSCVGTVPRGALAQFPRFILPPLVWNQGRKEQECQTAAARANEVSCDIVMRFCSLSTLHLRECPCCFWRTQVFTVRSSIWKSQLTVFLVFHELTSSEDTSPT